MYLKSLTLKGFKSFADRTQMVFDPGLNVVVGPNGSGKSNVSDAILWVLGEQSAKQLRGQAMEDVIFSGSSARGPVSVAEVTLVLDNSDGRLPVDFDEVAVTRRMYRSGESEYLVNAASARLRDIQDILHDSGLGKDTHSIISQGKLDAVLSSRPEERRSLIEEAAGISKHRRRKERSVRRLKAMEENVRRARDIDREIRRRLRPLERQVDKAKRFADLDGRRQALQAQLAVDDLRLLKGQWDIVAQRRHEAEASVELCRYRAQERAAELEKLQSLLEQKGLFVGDLGEQRRRVQDQLGRIESDMRLLEEKGRNMVAKLSDTRMTLSSVDHQASVAASDLERARAELDEVAGRQRVVTAKSSELQEKANRCAAALRTAEERSADAQLALRSAQRENDGAVLERARIKERLANAEVEDGLFQTRLDQLDEAIGASREALAAARAKAAETQKAADKARRDLDGAASEIARGSKLLGECRAAEDAARARLTERRARLEALKKVAASAAGSPRARTLAERKGASFAPGTLADRLRAPEELAPLVECLLSGAMGALVVTDEGDLANVADAALATAGTGSVTFVAMDPAVGEAAADAPGKALVSLLRAADPECPAAELALLAPVRVVDSAAEAVEAHRLRPDCVFCTTDLVVVDREGSVTVGLSDPSGSGVIERNDEVRALEEQMAGLERSQGEARERSREAKAALDVARRTQDEARDRASSLRGEADSLAREASRLEGQLSRSEAERASVAARREKAGEKARAEAPRLAELERTVEQSAAAIEEASSCAESCAKDRERAASEAAQAKEAANSSAVELATLTERRRHLTERVDALEKSMDSLAKRRQSAVEGTRSLEVLRLRVDPLHERYEAVLDAARTWAGRLRDRASLAEADSESLKKTIGDAKEASESAAAALEEAKERLSALDVEAGRLEVQVENAVAAVRESADMPLEEALELPAPDDRAESEAELASLVSSIKNLGPVNQVAMEEYTELKERADFIASQLADLEHAKAAIDKINAAIDRKMRRAFVETYKAVNANFQEIFAMLFPGGSATLVMDDPDHPAETGIDIQAQPKGKRIPKLALMSGGEKSLTALALLFAVYKTRTVPFYVFDEVEAALDDANLDKLLGAIERLKETTQLIVISHQRRTMEQADVLYGVSMQADGVSSVVSQRLDQQTGRVVDA
ncbi:chromosome segregation protein SMC [Atopobiaceae bacterium 24-176]